MVGAATFMAPADVVGAQQATPPETARPPGHARHDGGGRSDAAGGRRRAHDRQRRVRLHGGRHQVARVRVHLRQSGLELSRSPRIGHQLRRQSEARAHHLLPRRIVGGHGPRLLQSRRQAAGGDGAWHGRPAARGDGDLQRVVRPRARVHHPGQLRRCRDPPWRRVVPRRAGRRGHGPRLHEMGRHSVVARPLRRVGGARVPDRHDAADGAGRDRRRRPASRGRHQGSQRALDSEAHDADGCRKGTPPPWRSWRGCWSPRRTRCWSPIGWRERRRDAAARGAGGDAAGCRHRQRRTDELPLAPPSESVRAGGRRDRRRRMSSSGSRSPISGARSTRCAISSIAPSDR